MGRIYLLTGLLVVGMKNNANGRPSDFENNHSIKGRGLISDILYSLDYLSADSSDYLSDYFYSDSSSGESEEEERPSAYNNFDILISVASFPMTTSATTSTTATTTPAVTTSSTSRSTATMTMTTDEPNIPTTDRILTTSSPSTTPISLLSIPSSVAEFGNGSKGERSERTVKRNDSDSEEYDAMEKFLAMTVPSPVTSVGKGGFTEEYQDGEKQFTTHDSGSYEIDEWDSEAIVERDVAVAMDAKSKTVEKNQFRKERNDKINKNNGGVALGANGDIVKKNQKTMMNTSGPSAGAGEIDLEKKDQEAALHAKTTMAKVDDETIKRGKGASMIKEDPLVGTGEIGMVERDQKVVLDAENAMVKEGKNRIPEAAMDLVGTDKDTPLKPVNTMVKDDPGIAGGNNKMNQDSAMTTAGLLKDVAEADKIERDAAAAQNAESTKMQP